jgi:hypothetical protein
MLASEDRRVCDMSEEQRQLLRELRPTSFPRPTPCGVSQRRVSFSGETRRQFEIVAESIRGEIRQVAEGVALASESIDSMSRRMDTEFGEVKAAMKFSLAELDRRIVSLEAGLAFSRRSREAPGEERLAGSAQPPTALTETLKARRRQAAFRSSSSN